MENGKLMQIVQAVNDSHCNPIDIDSVLGYKFISRYLGSSLYKKESIHAIDKGEDSLIWQYICTVEEFNQCAKEMSAGYDKKESDMKNNKHPHHDLIVEWAKDTSKQPQIKKLANDSEWEDCRIHAVISNPKFLARFKPREFVKGHWYPCVFKGDNKDSGYPMMFDGGGFVNYKDDENSSRDINLSFIGESLGEINFGGGE